MPWQLYRNVSFSVSFDSFIAVYLLRLDRTPRAGEMFPRQEITLFDLSRAIVGLRLGVEPGRMWKDVKGRHDHDATHRVRADVSVL